MNLHTESNNDNVQKHHDNDATTITMSITPSSSLRNLAPTSISTYYGNDETNTEGAEGDTRTATTILAAARTTNTDNASSRIHSTPSIPSDTPTDATSYTANTATVANASPTSTPTPSPRPIYTPTSTSTPVPTPTHTPFPTHSPLAPTNTSSPLPSDVTTPDTNEREGSTDSISDGMHDFSTWMEENANIWGPVVAGILVVFLVGIAICARLKRRHMQRRRLESLYASMPAEAFTESADEEDDIMLLDHINGDTDIAMAPQQTTTLVTL